MTFKVLEKHVKIITAISIIAILIVIVLAFLLST